LAAKKKGRVMNLEGSDDGTIYLLQLVGVQSSQGDKNKPFTFCSSRTDFSSCMALLNRWMHHIVQFYLETDVVRVYTPTLYDKTRVL